MDEQKKQIADRIHQAQNILVAVSANPTVDQLSAAIGLTVAINKLDKHATAVFSGEIPSTIEFLKPEETLEKNTDSLRDFIIALDKSKADKLRYKVEDDVVRIFITPFRTSLSDKDLNFSQGDFNVDVVLALGVTEQQDLDTAITAHGRILHDATVVCLSNVGQGTLGSMNWVDPTASSLSEMAATLIDDLDKKAMDNQIATALLTGIVASTDRFSNTKTTPKTMSASAVLMAAGADQQLIATKLETPEPEEITHEDDKQAEGDAQEVAKPKPEPGTLEIAHDEDENEMTEPIKAPEPPSPQIKVDENGQLITQQPENLPEISRVRGSGSGAEPLGFDKPTEHTDESSDSPSGFAKSELTANSSTSDYDPPSEELTLPAVQSPILSHNHSVLTNPEPAAPISQSQSSTNPSPDQFVPQSTPPSSSAPASPVPEQSSAQPLDQLLAQSQAPEPTWDQLKASNYSPDSTLSDIEKSVASPHTVVGQQDALATAPSVDEARNAVEEAINNVGLSAHPEPIAALNSQPLGNQLQEQNMPIPPPPPPVTNLGFSEPSPGNSPADSTLDMPVPSNPFGPGIPPAANPFMSPSPTIPNSQNMAPGGQQTNGQMPPPPVPPPMLPPLQ